MKNDLPSHPDAREPVTTTVVGVERIRCMCSHDERCSHCGERFEVSGHQPDLIHCPHCGQPRVGRKGDGTR